MSSTFLLNISKGLHFLTLQLNSAVNLFQNFKAVASERVNQNMIKGNSSNLTNSYIVKFADQPLTEPDSKMNSASNRSNSKLNPQILIYH